MPRNQKKARFSVQNPNKMNHDITHCDNTRCAARMSCGRYIAHLDKIDRGLKGEYPYIVHNGTPDKCEEYLHIKSNN